jgi:peroxiredoxin
MLGSSTRAAPVFVIILALFVLPANASLQVGDIAPDFTLPDWWTGNPVSLHDFAGQVVLLDFFAYWCPHCQASSPEVQIEIQQYYHDRGGNPAGLPVQLVSLPVIQNRASNDAFIQNAGLDMVLDDGSQTAFSVYGYGYVPMFVLINGAAGANHQQWEVLYSTAGYTPGSTDVSFRQMIDGITPEPAAVLLLAPGLFLIRRRRAGR